TLLRDAYSPQAQGQPKGANLVAGFLASFAVAHRSQRRYAVLLVGLGIALTQSMALGVEKGSAATIDDWPAYLFSASRSDFNPGETTITPTSAGGLAAQWTVSTGGAVISGQPVTSNGLVYWGAWDGILRATKASDGSLAWSANLGQTPTPST